MAVLGRRGEDRWPPYVLLGAVVWYAMLCSGVHPTVAGVLAAFTVPLRPGRWRGDSLLLRFEHGLAPWSAYLIVPLFGLANAGVDLAGHGGGASLSPLALAVGAGLFLGKQAGVLGALGAARLTGFARLPEGASWPQLWGMAALCGIGFTMSLFIAALAFPHAPALVEEAKLGILGGSALSALLAGAALCSAAPKCRRRH